MTRQEFLDLCQTKIVILDGATGSNLQMQGMSSKYCPEEWILSHPDIFINLQKQYIEAGTDILYAPTFTANRIKLAEYGLENDIERINRELVSLSKQAALPGTYIAGDLTMTGKQLAPVGNLDFEQLVDIYKEQIHILSDAGVDLLVVETMLSLNECRAAIIAAKEVCDLPVMVSLTFESDGKTLFGTDPKTAVVVLQSLGAAAVGVNCSAGPKQMAEIIRKMKKVSRVPLLAKPNAGLPTLDKAGNTVYEMKAQEFADEMELILEAGAGIIGGCCGTTPKHIEKIHNLTLDGKYQPFNEIEEIQKLKGKRFLTSERSTLEFGLNDPFMIIGERINPTGKKKFQESIRNGDFSMVEAFVTQQEECGASMLDINMGMSGIDEETTLLHVMEDVSMLSSLPLCIDSSHVKVQETLLRRYPGRALINSVSLEKVKMEGILPLAKKYGAMFILLPLSDEGLPKSYDEKISIIEEIYRQAKDYGLSKEDIIVDGLVTTVGANKTAALETLETIRYCKEHEFATTCGLSNISFGLPERSFVNAAFITMAISAGLTMAIANPNQELLTACMLSSDLLLNKNNADIAYIDEMNRRKEAREHLTGAGDSQDKAKTNPASKDEDIITSIYRCVLKGNQSQIVNLCQKAIHDGKEPSVILDNALIAGINEVGRLFDKGYYFLPQLIAGAEAMKIAIEFLEPYLSSSDSDEAKKPTVVIATVEGDIHDIGKNLVALMLKNYGFNVIDLGKDVSKEKIVDAAIKENAKIIALSALMTTTMQQMRLVIEHAKELKVSAKVMIGGAVITQEYADEIGADGYSKDAADAVKVAKKLCETD